MTSPEFQRVLEIERAMGVYLASGPGLDEARERFPKMNEFPVADDLKVEHDRIGEMSVEIITPPDVDGDRTILYWHQGAFIMGAAAEFTGPLGELGRRARARVVVPDYRLAPEDPYPACVEDGLEAWRWLLDSGVPATSVAFAGDSAGGNLTVAVMLAARDAGVELPAAGVSLSAYLDLALTSESYDRNRETDPVITREACEWLAEAYLGGADPRTPLASPVYADLTGLPPLYISSGSVEAMFDDAARLAEKARQDGVEVTFDPAEGMVHMWYLFVDFLPEAEVTMTAAGEFIRAHTPVVA
jgi:monoterpene epsilon-lactone hydrolase